MKFYKSKAENVFSPDSVFMYSVSSSLDLKFDTSHLNCNTTKDNNDAVDYIKQLKNSSQPSTNSTTTLFIKDAVNVTLSLSRFENCGLQEKGGLFNLMNCPFYDSESMFTNLAAA